MAEHSVTVENTLQALLSDKKYSTIRDILVTMNPADIAAVFSGVEPEKLPLLFRLLPKELAAESFVEMESEEQEALVKGISDSELRQVMDELYVDDAVDIVEEMPANVVQRILAQSDPQMRKEINEILQYPESSAGSVMTTEYVKLSPKMTVGDAILRIRRTGVDKETIYTCYVLENHLIFGSINFRRHHMEKAIRIRMGVSILRIYSFTYLFRGGYLLFRNYLKILNLRSYEIKLTIAVIITNGIYLLCTMLGGAALWWANPISSMLLLIFTFVMNRRMVRASGGQLHGLLLIPREQKALQTINASLGLSRNEIARFGHKFQTMCEQNGMEPRNAAISAFAVEELLLNVLEARKRKDYADISARIYPDRMVIDFRTLGPAFQAEEMKLLQKISQTITHRTVAGMNCTRLELARRAPMPAESPVLPKAALKTE